MTPVKIITANLDFALKPKSVQNDLETLIEKGEILLLQEAKRVDVDHLIKDPKWKVHQSLKNDAVQGTAIAWNSERIRAGKRGRTIGTRPHGRGLLTRYITWITLYVKDEDSGKEYPIVVASAHLPPKRFWGFIYRVMINNIFKFVKSRRAPIVIGADWNKRTNRASDLLALARKAKGKMHGIGIDGFLTVLKGKWRVQETQRLAKNSRNGHHPIRIKITPTPKKR